MADQRDGVESGGEEVLCELFDPRAGRLERIRCSRDECLNDHNGRVIEPSSSGDG